MTRHQFTSNPELTGQLHQLLQNDVLVAALRIVMDEAKPERPDHRLGDLLHQAALTGARVEGYYQFRANLVSLTNFRKPASDAPINTSQADDAAIRQLIREGLTEDQAKAVHQQFLKETSNQQL